YGGFKMAVTDIAVGMSQQLRGQSKPAGQWTLAWRRLRRHRLAMFGLITLTTILLLSLLAPLISPYTYDEQDLRSIYAPWFTPGIEGKPMHALGTDGLGRDTLTRILYAGRISLAV